MLDDRRLYLVTPARADLEDFLEAAIRGGVDVVQIRDRELTDRRLLEALELARDVTRRHGVPLVVNDRADLARLVEADLVHIGQDDLPVAAVRRLGLAVGLSTHSPAEVEAADADYIGVGPIFETATKPSRQAAGLDLVRHAATHARLPWFAIGGIDKTTVQAVIEAGATRIAVVRALCDAQDPEEAARVLRAAVERAPAGIGTA